MKAGASKDGPPPSPRNVEEEVSSRKEDLTSLLPQELQSNQPSAFGASLTFQANIVANLVYSRRFSDTDAWNRALGSFMQPWLSDSSQQAAAFSESARSHYEAIDRAKFAPEQTGNEEEGEILCDTLFSLAYGTLLLLSHTSLRLIRGRRYGILGTNGSGKSTLMRQLRDGKVENFPPQSELRCVMVEHALQGEDTSLTIIDFIASG